ncbi:MAG: DUF2961 domain-containing protein [Planctomycetes bacterium]|nr:DUF2961 domain-containing protein [Planctomycetota bacterium]
MSRFLRSPARARRAAAVLCCAFGALAGSAIAQNSPWEREVFDLSHLPLAKRGVRCYMASSFDPIGFNDDGLSGVNSFRHIVQGNNGFPWFVVFDEEGPGVLNRLHFAFVDSIIPNGGFDEYELYFQFDDEPVPRFRMKAKDFVSGAFPPFVYPLAMDDRTSPGGPLISYPIAFERRLRVISDQVMHYFDWQFHRYPHGTPIRSFDPTRLPRYGAWERTVESLPAIPTPPRAGDVQQNGQHNLPTGAWTTIAALSGSGQITSLALQFGRPLLREDLRALQLEISFDGATSAQVSAPLGLFFGDELSESLRSGLLIGWHPERGYYTHFPMPYRTGCVVRVRNDIGKPIAVDSELRLSAYPAGSEVATFHANFRQQNPTNFFEEYVVLETSGHGHFVGASMTMGSDGFNGQRQLLTYLEGDERILVDGNRTPALHGTGTEEFFNWGWYEMPGASTFALPEHGHPSRWIEGTKDYSAMYRTMHADYVPFYSSIRVAFEVGPLGEVPASYRSVAYWYARPNPVLFSTDVLDVGNPASEQQHNFRAPNGGAPLGGRLLAYEGGWDPSLLIVDEGLECNPGQSTFFRLSLDPENRGALLRRRSSIQSWFQLADVFVDGQRVGRWRTIRVNPYRGWIDTDFEIPQAFTDEKAAIDVEIRPVADYFNAFRYEAFSYR